MEENKSGNIAEKSCKSAGSGGVSRLIKVATQTDTQVPSCIFIDKSTQTDDVAPISRFAIINNSSSVKSNVSAGSTVPKTDNSSSVKSSVSARSIVPKIDDLDKSIAQCNSDSEIDSATEKNSCDNSV